MNKRTVTLVAVLCMTAAWAPARAQTVETSVVKIPQDIVYKGPPGVVALTPVEMKWASQGGLAKPGPYTLRLKFPKGFKIAPHTHPDFREVTILSGRFATGYGEKFDAADLKILPAGSFYTEPANVPHYIEIKEDVVLQVSGMGPSERRFVSPGPK